MKFVIFHGAFGSNNGNWFPWLKNELKKLHQDVILQQYPVDDFDEITKRGKKTKETIQNLKSWMNFFERNTLPLLKENELPVFIGHSLSSVFILHVVNKYRIKLDTAIFASPFLEALANEKTWQFDVVNSTFYKKDFDFNQLKKLIPMSYVLYGTDDPYVPNSYCLDYANKLSSVVMPIKNGGHLGSNLKQFPEVLQICKDRINNI